MISPGVQINVVFTLRLPDGPPPLMPEVRTRSIDRVRSNRWVRSPIDPGNNKGEVNHIRRIVLACERDMEVGPRGVTAGGIVLTGTARSSLKLVNCTERSGIISDVHCMLPSIRGYVSF